MEPTPYKQLMPFYHDLEWFYGEGIAKRVIGEIELLISEGILFIDNTKKGDD